MKKQSLFSVLWVVLFACMLPLAAMASSADEPVYVRGNVIQSGAGDGWRYDSATRTLTLVNFKTDSRYNNVPGGAVIYTKGNLNIRLLGDSKLTHGTNTSDKSYGIYVGGKLTIQGDPEDGSDSKLDIWISGRNPEDATDDPLTASIHAGGELTIKDCTINAAAESYASSGNTEEGYAYAISSDSSIKIDGGKVTASSNTDTKYSKTPTTSSNAQVDADGNYTDTRKKIRIVLKAQQCDFTGEPIAYPVHDKEQFQIVEVNPDGTPNYAKPVSDVSVNDLTIIYCDDYYGNDISPIIAAGDYLVKMYLPGNEKYQPTDSVGGDINGYTLFTINPVPITISLKDKTVHYGTPLANVSFDQSDYSIDYGDNTSLTDGAKAVIEDEIGALFQGCEIIFREDIGDTAVTQVTDAITLKVPNPSGGSPEYFTLEMLEAANMLPISKSRLDIGAPLNNLIISFDNGDLSIEQCTLTAVEAKAATCSATGNIAHYKCVCGKLYSDAEGTTETTEAAVTLPIDPEAHSYGTAPTYTYNEDTHTAVYSCEYDSSHTKSDDPATHAYDETTYRCVCGMAQVFTLSISSEGRGTASAPATGVFGEQIVLTASPEEGYRLAQWVIQPEGIAVANNSFLMPGENVTIKAVFEHICFDSRDLDNHTCDYEGCGRKVSGVCWDSGDAGHECNECGQVLLGECVDDDCDHYCDFCPIQLTTCNDARDDIDHLCDMCGAQVANPEPCWDNTSLELDVDGHICNAIGCGKQIDPSVKDFCWDFDKDGKCEECGWVIGTPVVTPTPVPTTAPTVAPTAAPTVAPTAAPTVAPTTAPTAAPTAAPTVAPTAAPTVEPTAVPTAEPQYKVVVEGKNGTITRTNDTSVIYEDLYIRYSIGYDMGGTSYAVIAMLKVDWIETQEGVVGTFTIPRIQGSGTVTGASYIVTTNENADGLSLAGAVKNSCGMLIQ